MNSFLYRVAQTFYTHYHGDISTLSFVFPNRRAGLFFQRYLSEIAGKPLFSPEILTINECFALGSEEKKRRAYSCHRWQRLALRGQHIGYRENIESSYDSH